jgi:transcriptional regulator NrdR family protein
VRCPKCQHKTDVLETIPGAGRTRRRRRCLNDACGHRFTTLEARQEELKSEGEAMALRELRAVSGHRGAVDPEALAAALAMDRRKAEFRRQQQAERARAEAEGYDVDGDRALSPYEARRLIRGY